MKIVVSCDGGSIVQFRPIDEEAIAWIKENVETESWQWLGAALCVDSRYAGPLIEGFQEAGGEIE